MSRDIESLNFGDGERSYPVTLPVNEIPFWLETMRSFEVRKIEAPYAWGGQEAAHAEYDNSPAPGIISKLNAHHSALEIRSSVSPFNPVLACNIILSEREVFLMLDAHEEVNRLPGDEFAPQNHAETLRKRFESARIRAAGQKRFFR